jgi:hypothetical protein
MTTGPESRPEPTREANSDAPSRERLDVDARAMSALDRLHGLMREDFAEYGGGEAFLKWLRTDPEDAGPRKWGTTMEIRYTLTIPEFKEGYGMMWRQASFRHRINYWYFTWLGLVMGLWILLMALVLFGTPHPNQPFVLLLAVFGLAAVSTPWRYRGLIRRNYRLQNLNTELSVSANSEGITVKRANKDAVSHYGWTAIERFVQSKNLFILFPGRLQFIPVPKRAMPPEQQQEFRALLEAHIPAAGPRNRAASAAVS